MAKTVKAKAPAKKAPVEKKEAIKKPVKTTPKKEDVKEKKGKTLHIKCSKCKESKFANAVVYASRIKKYGTLEKAEKEWICRDCKCIARGGTPKPKLRDKPRSERPFVISTATISELVVEAERLGFDKEDLQDDKTASELRKMIKMGTSEYYEEEDEEESGPLDDPFEDEEELVEEAK